MASFLSTNSIIVKISGTAITAARAYLRNAVNDKLAKKTRYYVAQFL